MGECYYCLQNIRDEKCEFNIEGYPLPMNVKCRHFEFDTGSEFKENDQTCSENRKVKNNAV